jgi:hypothetical protein
MEGLTRSAAYDIAQWSGYVDSAIFPLQNPCYGNVLPCALRRLLAVGVVTWIERTHIAAGGRYCNTEEAVPDLDLITTKPL